MMDSNYPYRGELNANSITRPADIALLSRIIKRKNICIYKEIRVVVVTYWNPQQKKNNEADRPLSAREYESKIGADRKHPLI